MIYFTKWWYVCPARERYSNAPRSAERRWRHSRRGSTRRRTSRPWLQPPFSSPRLPCHALSVPLRRERLAEDWRWIGCWVAWGFLLPCAGGTPVQGTGPPPGPQELPQLQELPQCTFGRGNITRRRESLGTGLRRRRSSSVSNSGRSLKFDRIHQLRI